MKNDNFGRTRLACYYTYMALSSVFSFPPIMFVTFREMYNISYTLLGTLVLINFCTQLAIDLIFSFFGKHFPLRKVLQIMPLLTSLGLLVYGLVPHFFPQYAYGGFAVGTVIFSVASGLCEVLLSPTIAALPSDNPDRDMSRLHSLYGYGVLCVVGVSTLYLTLFGRENWLFLCLLWAVLPIGSFYLFSTSPLPDLRLSHGGDAPQNRRSNFGLVLCVLCIFFGSAAENSMTSWISGYIERVLGVSKTWGDIIGLALFALLLAFTRTWYSKYGKNIYRVLLVGMVGAAICYLTIGLTSHMVIGLTACVLTGCFTSMLWPGSLVLMEEKFPSLGVAAYAMMAAGGDFGASVAPQALGVVADAVAASGFGVSIADRLALTPEQIGLKAAMLLTVIFPLLGVGVLLLFKWWCRKNKV